MDSSIHSKTSNMNLEAHKVIQEAYQAHISKKNDKDIETILADFDSSINLKKTWEKE